MWFDEVTAAPVEGSSAGLSGLLGHIGPRSRKALTAYLLAKSFTPAVKAIRARIKEEVTYTVAVEGSDELYPDVHTLVLALMAPKRRRALTARTTTRHNDDAMPVLAPGEARPPAGVRLSYDGKTRQTIELRGHRVEVAVETPDLPGGRITEEERKRYPYLAALERIVFTTRGTAARDAVVAELEAMAQARNQPGTRKPRLYICNHWGNWSNRNSIPRRDPASVVLPAGQRERIFGDLGEFLARGDDYLRLGQPWHRAILLEGPPGTGKTSLARALATHFALDLYYIPLGDLKEDANLISLVSEIETGCMLLLEDIDVFKAATSREQTIGGLSLSGLLNALDGVATPPGLITVMTTNDMTGLDEALIRPGRVDRVEHVGFLDDEQLHDLVAAMFEDDAYSPPLPSLAGLQLSPATVTELFKRHLGNPNDAVAELMELILNPLSAEQTS